MKLLKISLSIIVVILGLYVLISGNYSLLPLNLLSLSLLLFVSGVEELTKKRRGVAYTYFLVSGFNIVVSFNILGG
ncbi:DUF3953 domain-containing protein [Ornithinibacillus sp. L9]|uniref:DUF3953 domain-containing protein n=1 Tax=Ornithinibacillus caprae TaxID=2678566 RepID=A0A6N8FL01_9BACI|nr:DUF3953 domain-containing protein [Ornithinibacillus caprae]MUK90135.1 DUF3953 domain-containing protein [Ornithinibacillus caprae]